MDPSYSDACASFSDAERQAVKRRRVRTDDGAVLAVQEGGRSDGPPLLLLPGQANSHQWWNGLRGRLGRTRKTVTFDYRGTGGTTAPESSWSTTSFADDAARVLRSLDITRADVYATSMGGRVAQMLAIGSPELVGRLVLACTSPGGSHAVEPSRLVHASLADPDPAARREALLDLMYTPGWRDAGRVSNLLGDPTMTRRARRLHRRASKDHDGGDQLATIRLPTLILHGESDLMVPVTNAFRLAEHIPGARLETFPDGRHGFFDEFEDEVSTIVEEFLRP